jgi:hypothetical protein
MGIFSKLFGGSSSEGSQKPDTEQVEIVGESFYKGGFKELRQRYGAKVGDRVPVKVLLSNEMDNPYGVNGKAVSAYVDGLKIGHVANYQVPNAFESLEAMGGSKAVSGSVYFADLRETVSKNSVEANFFVKRHVAPSEDPRYISKRQELEKQGDEGKEKLKAGGWAKLKLNAGDVVCFTGFTDNRDFLEAKALAAGIALGGVNKKLTLLVVNEEWLDDSAKTRDAIAKGIPVANLASYLHANPNLKP